ncbi:MAG TPA: thermonuclease family protein [Candidatus Saccharimonadales bacterium]|nr:thermonuclease family protein [Candidatus Saccharimonadales bacterium]
MKRSLKRRHASGLVALIIGLGLLLAQHYGWTKAPAQVLEKSQPGLYSVVHFDDGDTIDVNMNGTREKIRFIGVDTPETHDPRKAVQCFGQAAASFTKQLIGSNSVRLESDPLSSNRDRYNRLLRYIYLPNGTLVNLEIIKQGYGFAYTSFPFTKSDQFLAAQTTARQQNRGLWHNCQPTKNQYGGYTSNNAN